MNVSGIIFTEIWKNINNNGDEQKTRMSQKTKIMEY